jgi:HSP20 family protein
MFGLVPRRRNRGEGALSPTTGSNPLEMMRREFESVFDRFLGGWPLAENWNFGHAWGVAWSDNEKELVLRAEMPGFELPEVDVRVAGDVLTITAEHKPAEGEARELQRSFTLPSGLDKSKVDAVYRNGILEVHLPKSPEVQPRKIEVKA